MLVDHRPLRSRRSESPQAAGQSIAGANDQAASLHRPRTHPGLSPKQDGLRKPAWLPSELKLPVAHSEMPAIS